MYSHSHSLSVKCYYVRVNKKHFFSVKWLCLTSLWFLYNKFESSEQAVKVDNFKSFNFIFCMKLELLFFNCLSHFSPDNDEAISNDGGLLVPGQHQPTSDDHQQLLA